MNRGPRLVLFRVEMRVTSKSRHTKVRPLACWGRAGRQLTAWHVLLSEDSKANPLWSGELKTDGQKRIQVHFDRLNEGRRCQS